MFLKIHIFNIQHTSRHTSLAIIIVVSLRNISRIDYGITEYLKHLQQKCASIFSYFKINSKHVKINVFLNVYFITIPPLCMPLQRPHGKANCKHLRLIRLLYLYKSRHFCFKKFKGLCLKIRKFEIFHTKTKKRL